MLKRIEEKIIELNNNKIPLWMSTDEEIEELIPTSHMDNFISCVRDRSKPISDVFTAHRANSSALLAHSAMLLGRTLKWNPDKQEFVDDEEANQLLSRPSREPYTI